MKALDLVIALLLVASCRNDAITYAHLIDPDAECQAMHTDGLGPTWHEDSAVCRIGSDMYHCRAPERQVPACFKVSINSGAATAGVTVEAR